jgi:ABC-type multidrug transport system fused ATPase/permease subunit
MLLGAVLEVVGISAVLPFIALVLDVSLIERYPLLQQLYRWSGTTSSQNFVFLICVLLVIVFLLKNLFLFFVSYRQNRFIAEKQVAMSRDLFSAYLQKPYEFFFTVNTAELQRNLNGVVSLVANGVLLNGMGLVAEVLVVTAIFLLLLFIDPVSSCLAFSFIGTALGLSYWASRRRAQEYAQQSTQSYANMIRWLNQGIGSIKEVKVMGKEGFFLRSYLENSHGCANATAKHQVLLAAPRIYFETVTVAAMCIIVVINLLSETPPQVLMATLGLFAMAAFRLMPAMSRMATMLTTIRFGVVQLNLIYADLVSGTSSETTRLLAGNESLAPLRLQKQIRLNNISYCYPGSSREVLQNINISIPQGSSVGLIGSSGAGKTTLVDIILGLLPPSTGTITVDETDIWQHDISEWHGNLGYIPQQIYLLDDTVARNVAFGVPDDQVDMDRVWQVLKIAQMQEYVMQQPAGLDTKIGEQGICLSGGQRQRIGIARALYHDPQILVLDEATSALDTETESSFMAAVEAIGNEKTLIIIAHRLSTIRHCDVVYEIDKGRLEIVQPAD